MFRSKYFSHQVSMIEDDSRDIDSINVVSSFELHWKHYTYITLLGRGQDIDRQIRSIKKEEHSDCTEEA